MKRLAILGSTGSIGQSTLSIVEQFPERYQVAALAAGRNVEEAFAQAQRWRPRLVSLATEELANELAAKLCGAGVTGIEVVHGSAGTIACSTLPEADFVVSAIVGVAGLEATHAAILAGKPVGLANKECMVAAGEILTAAARERKVPILPIDSEHNAVHQCLRVGAHNEVKFIWLTASGGPFRQLPLDQFEAITPEQALKHPTWVMGRRITIDSATMLNKGLEVIEACRLFDVTPAQVRVTHPSAVHSALAGGVCGRVDPGADFGDRYAAADPVCAGMAGAAGVHADLRSGRAEAPGIRAAGLRALPLPAAGL